VDGGLVDDTLIYKFSASGSPSWTSSPIPEPDANASYSWTTSPVRLAVDPAGSTLFANSFSGSADFGSAGTLTSAGGADAAVLRFDAQGHLIGSGRWGGAEDDLLVDVAVDGAGDAVIAGWSAPPSAVGGDESTYAVFVAKLGW
jgi:hypothetical protein